MRNIHANPGRTQRGEREQHPTAEFPKIGLRNLNRAPVTANGGHRPRVARRAIGVAAYQYIVTLRKLDRRLHVTYGANRKNKCQRLPGALGDV